MDALREWIMSDLDVIMLGIWMLCGNGYGLIISDLDVLMVGA